MTSNHTKEAVDIQKCNFSHIVDIPNRNSGNSSNLFRYLEKFRRIDEKKYLYDASAYNKKAQCSWTAESHCISTNEEMARKKLKWK